MCKLLAPAAAALLYKSYRIRGSFFAIRPSFLTVYTEYYTFLYLNIPLYQIYRDSISSTESEKKSLYEEYLLNIEKDIPFYISIFNTRSYDSIEAIELSITVLITLADGNLAIFNINWFLKCYLTNIRERITRRYVPT